MQNYDHSAPEKRSAHADSWLTARRLRAHGTLLALCLWSVYLWNVATPSLRDRNGNLKGTDFLHFYTLGLLAADHRGADLYDMNAQAALAAQRVPDAAGIRYLPLYPPQVSIFFAPLAHFFFGWALILWWSCGSLIYMLCCYSVWRACPNLRDHRGTVTLIALAFPAFFHLLAWGQTSAIALACFTLAFFLLRDGQEFLAGAVLGCLIFKPQLGLAAAVLFVSVGAWKILLGAVLSAVVQLFAGVFYYGIEPLRQWTNTMWKIRTILPLLEPKPYQTHSLRTFWSMLVPWPKLSLGLYLLSAAFVLGLTIACWRRSHRASHSLVLPLSGSLSLSLPYSAMLFASVLVAPHLTVYDLLILAPAFLLLADWLIGQPSTNSNRLLGPFLYLAYMLPLIGPLTRWTHIQLSVIAMAAAVYLIWQICREAGSCTAAIQSKEGESVVRAP